MPVRLRPSTLVCCECGWKKTVAPLSDALSPADWCERCGHDALSLQATSAIDRILAEWYARLWR